MDFLQSAGTAIPVKSVGVVMPDRVKKGQLRIWNNETKTTFVTLTRKTIKGIVRQEDLGWGGRDRGLNIWTVFERGEILEEYETEIYHGSKLVK